MMITLPISDIQVTKIKLVIKYQKKNLLFLKGYYFAKHSNLNHSKKNSEFKIIPAYEIIQLQKKI